MVYYLTERGKGLKYSDWKREPGRDGGAFQDDGCALSDIAAGIASNRLRVTLGDLDNLTLGEIAAASPLAERELARFAYCDMGRDDRAICKGSEGKSI